MENNLGKVTLVRDINLGSDYGFNDSSIYNLEVFNNKVYFSANNGVNGRELWVSDGTTGGTQLIKNINPGRNSYGAPRSSNPYGFIELNNKLYFTANDRVNGGELWVTNGTENGTKLVVDINPGSESSVYDYSNGLTEFNNKLYFSANDGVNGRELWVTDGTTGGTKLLKDIDAEGSYSSSNPSDFTEFNNKLLFSADDGVNGTELWVTDGTTGGTKLVKDINPGSFEGYYGGTYPDSSYPRYFTELNNKLLFSANDGVNGRELWVTDGTTGGTKLLKDINPGSSEGYNGETFPDSSYLNDFTIFNNKLYFSANDGENGTELWVTDGTANGTQLVADINPGSEGSDVGGLTVVGQELFFTANNGLTGRELFKLSFDNSTTITGTNGADNLNGNNLDNKIEGLNGEDTLSGLGGNDTLTGGNGKDSLDGGAGNDSLLGGIASDTLIGGNGNDILNGGAGSNLLTGGAGNDVFAIKSGNGSESIADFKLGKDLIGLTGELEFDDLTLSGNTIKAGSDLLATITGVETAGLTEADFTTI
jgi:ELWxxDGT repeat protein